MGTRGRDGGVPAMCPRTGPGSSSLFLFLILVLRTGSRADPAGLYLTHHVAMSDLSLLTLLSPRPKSWGCIPALQQPVSGVPVTAPGLCGSAFSAGLYPQPTGPILPNTVTVTIQCLEGTASQLPQVTLRRNAGPAWKLLLVE